MNDEITNHLSIKPLLNIDTTTVNQRERRPAVRGGYAQTKQRQKRNLAVRREEIIQYAKEKP